MRDQWLTPAQQKAWRSYLVGSQLLWERLDRDLKTAHGLSLAEYEVMVRLSEAPDGQLRMTDLAKALCHSRSRVTHTVKRMQVDGLVFRASALNDGRGVVAVMSDMGWQRLREAAPTHVQGVREHFLAHLSAEDFELIGQAFDAVADPLVEDNPEVDLRLSSTD